MSADPDSRGTYQQIYDMVSLIPPGQVASYGQIARLLIRCTPRMVGYAMAAVPADLNVPWHRVINSQGKCSPRKHGSGDVDQRVMLEREGIIFDARGRLNFNTFGWPGPEPENGEYQ